MVKIMNDRKEYFLSKAEEIKDLGYKVYVVDENGIIHLREVKTGTDDNKQIEVLEGLEPGDIVITGSFDGLTDGMKVDVTLEGDES